MPLSGSKPARFNSGSGKAFHVKTWDAKTRLRVLFVLGALPAAAVALLAPKAIALPLASLISLLLAAAVAAYAMRSQAIYRAQGLTFWDLAGMLALIGFGAGAMSEPAAALELFGMSATR